MCIHIHIYIYIYTKCLDTVVVCLLVACMLAYYNDTGRGHCLHIPRFEESLNNQKEQNTTFEEQHSGISADEK